MQQNKIPGFYTGIRYFYWSFYVNMLFWALFKSITFDNETEFRDFKEMFESIFDKKSRTKIYYTNPYHSWERGSNENGNRMMREFFSKVTDFSTINRKINIESDKFD